MQTSSERSCCGLRPLRERGWILAPLVVALPLLNPAVLFAGDTAPTATSQTSRETTNDEASSPNVLTGRDFGILMKIMHTNIVRCGGPFTAVLHWHVLPDGVIDDFILNKPSGDVCFDGIVIVNAEAVVRAKLRMTPAMRNGVAEAGWVPLAVASRD